MPNSNFKDSDRFNLMLALTAFLVDGREYQIDELVYHFNAPEHEIRVAIRTIGFTELIEIYPRGPYQVDFDDLKEGFVSISFSHIADLTDVPRLSPRQASAIVAGLVYLKSLPGLAEVGEIEELLGILSNGINREEAILEIDIVPGSIDADLIVIRDALSRGLSISCDYLNNRGETTIGRIIEPLRLEPTAEVVYVRAFCPVKNSVRSFRLDRMRQARVLEDKKISDEARAAELSDEIYTPSENDLDVVMEVDPEAYGLIQEFKPAEQPVQVSQYVKRFTVKIGDVRTLGRIIARFGGAARVISPPEAKKAVYDFALEALSGKLKRTPRDAE
ncbi:MAG: WYL domain-containing protein [Rhodoluna sp.]